MSYHREVRKKRPSSAEVHESFRRTNVTATIDAVETRTGEVEQQLVYSPPIGSLMPYVGESDPPGGKWLVADGRTISIESYPDYAAVAGTAFNTGGEPAGHVRLPNTSGRGVIGSGTGAGLTARARGGTGGSETHNLTLGETARHGHGNATGQNDHHHTTPNKAGSDTRYQITGTFGTGGGARWVVESLVYSGGDTSQYTHEHSIPLDGGPSGGAVGSSQAHNNMSPWIAMPHIVRVLI